MIFGVELGHIEEQFELQFAGLKGPWWRQRGGRDLPRSHCRETFRRATGLDHCYVSVRLNAMSAQSDARGKIGKRAEAGDAEDLAFEVLDPVDARHGVNPEEKFLDDGSNDHRVGAGEISLD